ncbi:hypothetical protein [Mycobacterium sp. HNNTM2301]
MPTNDGNEEQPTTDGEKQPEADLLQRRPVRDDFGGIGCSRGQGR